MLSIVIPTKDRHAELKHTLARLAALGAHAFDPIGGAELIVVDNASATPVLVAQSPLPGMRVRVLRSERNLAAAARNLAAEDARGEWLLMLDDDSSPLDASFVEHLLSAPAEVAALAADIALPGALSREAGGLPEVFVGCGVAVRAQAFHECGGYDRSFGFYAEEYDLAAKLLLAGARVRHQPGFRVEHRKVTAGRDMNGILRRLVRNNAVVAQRYAPDDELDRMLAHTVDRYRAIAEREGATAGYEVGLRELNERLAAEPRTPMPAALWRRFTGEAAARVGAERLAAEGARAAAIVERGKNDWAVERALRHADIEIVGERDDAARADVRVVGTLSPGPVLDALGRLSRGATGDASAPPVVALWSPSDDVGDGERRTASTEADDFRRAG